MSKAEDLLRDIRDSIANFRSSVSSKLGGVSSSVTSSTSSVTDSLTQSVQTSDRQDATALMVLNEIRDDIRIMRELMETLVQINLIAAEDQLDTQIDLVH